MSWLNWFGFSANIDCSGKSYTVDEWVRSQIPIFEARLINEESVVNGCVILFDWAGSSMKFQSFFGLEKLTRTKETNVSTMYYWLCVTASVVPMIDYNQSSVAFAFLTCDRKEFS